MTDTLKTLTFYIIFHKQLYQYNTKEFTSEELDNFTWVAVNEKIPKDYPTWIPKSSMIKEYEMNKHSPLFQMLNFYQNSVFFHLYWNSHLIKSKYVGFGQYDMHFNAEEFRNILSILNNDPEDRIVVPVFAYSFYTLYNVMNEEFWEKNFIIPYNTFYFRNHTLESLKHIPLFLLHTFIIPTSFFLRMMPFVEKNLPNILKGLNWDVRNIAGTLERVFALCISCGIAEGIFKKMVKLQGVSHIESQHSEDLLRGINVNPS